VTEEEEDEEYLKEEDALASAGGTRLLIQPSCERFLDDFIESFISFTSLYTGDVSSLFVAPWKVELFHDKMPQNDFPVLFSLTSDELVDILIQLFVCLCKLRSGSSGWFVELYSQLVLGFVYTSFSNISCYKRIK
jgi:hypothetical protein